MFDYGLSVMEQYSMEVQKSYRGRGALFLQTREGLFILQPFKGTDRRLKGQQELLISLDGQGIKVDIVIPNREGELVSKDAMGDSYVLRRWYEGRECDTRQEEDILISVKTLASLHRGMYLPVDKNYINEPLDQEYDRHNRELRKIQRFIRKKGAENSFERLYLQNVEIFLKDALDALCRLKETSYGKMYEDAIFRGSVCHGEFNQHHILIGKETSAVTGFDKWGFGPQISDLYRFMRKVLEKYNWDILLGEKMLLAYERERPLSERERKHLYIQFSYPEKFWKLANYYYTHNKAWISGKNVEKMNNIIRQRDNWKFFWQHMIK